MCTYIYKYRNKLITDLNAEIAHTVIVRKFKTPFKQ